MAHKAGKNKPKNVLVDRRRPLKTSLWLEEESLNMGKPLAVESRDRIAEAMRSG